MQIPTQQFLLLYYSICFSLEVIIFFDRTKERKKNERTNASFLPLFTFNAHKKTDACNDAF